MRVALILGAVLLAGAATAVFVASRSHEPRHHPIMRMLGFGCRCSPERGSTGSIRTLATAQADFRANDRDGNGKQDFWRKDVAGLYTVRGTDGQPNKLIELSMAAADDRPASKDIDLYTVRGPKAGYWYRAIPHAGEKTPDPDRFAFCAFPADYPASGKWTFILNEGNTVFKRDLGRPGGIEVFPDDAELAAHWSKLD